jgi:hypothetical protein
MHLGQPHLVVEGAISGAEAVAQDLGDERADRFVPGTCCESCDDLGKVLLSPSAEHVQSIVPSLLRIKSFSHSWL